MIQKNLFVRQKQTDFENQTYGYHRGNRGGEGETRRNVTQTFMYVKQIINKDLLRSTGKSTHYCVITYMGKGSENKWICV